MKKSNNLTVNITAFANNWTFKPECKNALMISVYCFFTRKQPYTEYVRSVYDTQLRHIMTATFSECHFWWHSILSKKKKIFYSNGRSIHHVWKVSIFHNMKYHVFPGFQIFTSTDHWQGFCLNWACTSMKSMHWPIDVFSVEPLMMVTFDIHPKQCLPLQHGATLYKAWELSLYSTWNVLIS